ncbi:AAA family ATPase, partial [Burkholderia vietnamiensis]|nr:AAA family ATPase [Burkholderia vietnamiensis]
RALLHAFGAARLDGRDVIAPADIRADEGAAKRRPIGF